MLVLFLAWISCGKSPAVPQLVGDVNEIEGAKDLDDHEGRGEGLRNKRQSEDHRRQIDEIAKHKA